MNVIDALNWRYAVRQFSSEQLEDEKIQQLLNATRLSATSYGLQPYRLIMVNDRAVREKLLEHSMGQEKVLNCSHLVVLAVQRDVDDRLVDRYIHATAKAHAKSVDDLQGYANHIKKVFAGMNSEQKREWAHQQAYIALGTLLTAAAVMKIDSCPMTGFESKGFDRVLGLGKMGLESSIICALGIRHPDDGSAQLPKIRYSHTEMVIAV